MKRKKLTPWSFLLSLLVMLLLSNGEHSSHSYSRLVLALLHRWFPLSNSSRSHSLTHDHDASLRLNYMGV